MIHHKFSLQLPDNNYHTMYALLKNGKYTKTHIVDGQIKMEYIDIKEYAAALVQISLPSSGYKLVPNKLL